MDEHRILVSIDTILDTVMAVAMSMDEENLPRLAEEGYHVRFSNDLSFILPEFDMEEFNSRWAKRDVSILRLAFSTPVLSQLMSRMEETTGLPEDHPLATSFELTLNTYPYRLSEEDSKAMQEHLSGLLNVDITMIRYPLRKLTPKWLRDNCSQFIIRDLDEWVGVHLDELGTTNIPEVSCIAPFTLREGVEPGSVPPGELDDIKKALVSTFSAALDLEIVTLGTMSISGSDEDQY